MTVGYAYFSRDLYIPLGYIYISVGISIFLWGYIYSDISDVLSERWLELRCCFSVKSSLTLVPT